MLAAGELIEETVPVKVEIMVPQVCTSQELKRVYGMIRRVERRVKDRLGLSIPFKVGTMLKLCVLVCELEG